MSDVEIRPTIPDDLDALAEVLVQVHASDGYPVEGVDDPRAWVDPPNAVGQWTALLDGRPAGHIALMRPTPEDGAPEMLARREGMPLAKIAVLGRLFVAPEARGHGLAGALMDAAEVVAVQSDLTVVLDVMAKDTAAINLYEKRGWETLGTFGHALPEGENVAAWALVLPRLDTA